MSSTATRWFVPDQEFHRTINDDAVVGQTATSVFADLSKTDNAPTRIIGANDTFFTEYHRLHSERCYDFAVQGQLVYADVDDENPEHKEKIDEWAKAIPFEEETSRTKLIKKELLLWAVDKSVSNYHPDEYGWYVNEEDRWTRKESWILKDLQMFLFKGFLEPSLISRILTATIAEEKEDILYMMSGQMQHPIKRPVLALIDLIDSKQTTEVGETKGWAIGFDFVKELLIIKPFLSKAGTHPLGAKWYGAVAQDGVSFCGTLEEFAKAYIELGESVGADANHNGFKLLVHTLAAEWMDGLGSDLYTVHDIELRKAERNIWEAMMSIPFPAVQKTKKEDAKSIEPFVQLLSTIERQEIALRDSAVEAEKQGDAETAQNAAKLYESIHGQIKAFIEKAV